MAKLTFEQYQKNVQQNLAAKKSSQSSTGSGSGGSSVKEGSYEYFRGLLDEKPWKDWSSDWRRGREYDIAPVTANRKAEEKAEEEAEEEEDDIAPWYTGYFAKGVFEDGYDFGDITKSILGTGGDILEELIVGGMGLGESIMDAGSVLAPYKMQGDFYQNGGIYTLAQQEALDKRVEQEKLLQSEQIKKDLYDEQEIVKNASKGILGVDVDDYSVFGEKMDANMQSLGQMLVRTGANIVLPGASAVMMGASVLGSQAEKALNEGATFDEAAMSGVISAAGEMLSEQISGPIKIKGLDLDLDASAAIKTISSKAVRTLAQMGMDMAGEGAEEILSSVISAIGEKLTYADEKQWNELLSGEDLLDSFLGGAILGVVGGGAQAAKSAVQGTDYATGLTKNEQKVVDTLYKERVDEQKGKNGKVTQSQKSKIYDDILREMDKGYLSVDDIGRGLGNKTYEQYKKSADFEDSLQKEYDALKEEFDTLRQAESGDMTREQTDRRNELLSLMEQKNKQIQNVKATSGRESLLKQMESEVEEAVKNDRLMESFNERNRRGAAFEADLTQYDAKTQEVYERAVNSGVLNNTNRSHELVDFVAKIETDKGIRFDFTNNQRLNKSGFGLKGKTVNGYVTPAGVTLNTQSSKYLQSVAGHEITHVLEGTAFYEEMQNLVFDYAKPKGDYLSRYNAFKELYKDVYKDLSPEEYDAKINAEVAADLVGDYLFADTDFINSLSTQNRNVFQKVWDEIKYLCKVATAGSKEAKELERVKHLFEKAYREGGKTNPKSTKYHLSENLESEVDKVLNNEWDSSNQVKARDFTPGILVENGVRDLPMLITQKHIQSTVYSEAEAKNLGLPTGRRYNYHGLGKDLLLRSIDSMDNPSAIYKKDADHYLIITEQQDSDGNDIIVPVKIDGTGVYNNVYIDENQISSVYGKKNLQNYLARNNFELIYEKKGTALNEGVHYSNIGDSTTNSIPENSEKSSDYSLSAIDAPVYDNGVALEAPVNKKLEALIRKRAALEYKIRDFEINGYERSEYQKLYGEWEKTNDAVLRMQASAAPATGKNTATAGKNTTATGKNTAVEGKDDIAPVAENTTASEAVAPKKETTASEKARTTFESAEDLNAYIKENYDYDRLSEEEKHAVQMVAKRKREEAYLADLEARLAEEGDKAAETGDLTEFNRLLHDLDEVKESIRDKARFKLPPLRKPGNGQAAAASDYTPADVDAVFAEGERQTLETAKKGIEHRILDALEKANEAGDWKDHKRLSGKLDKLNARIEALDKSTQEAGQPKLLTTAEKARKRLLNDAVSFDRLFASDTEENRARYEAVYKATEQAQKLISEGTEGVKPVAQIFGNISVNGKLEDFESYLHHQLNIDRTTLKERGFGENKPVFDTEEVKVSTEESRQEVKRLEEENPEFQKAAGDVYAFFQHLDKMLVDGGAITQETSAHRGEMYPHYVGISRARWGEQVSDSLLKFINENSSGTSRIQNVDKFFEDVDRAHTNYKITSSGTDFLPLMDTMVDRALRTYWTVAMQQQGAADSQIVSEPVIPVTADSEIAPEPTIPAAADSDIAPEAATQEMDDSDIAPVLAAPTAGDTAIDTATDTANDTETVVEQQTGKEPSPDAPRENDPVSIKLMAEPEGIKRVAKTAVDLFNIYVLDDAIPFEKTSKYTGNDEVHAKFHAIRNAYSSAQYFLGHGNEATGVRAINDIYADVKKKGLKGQFDSYLAHQRNIDGRTMKARYTVAVNQEYLRDVSLSESYQAVKDMEAEHPEFRQWSQDIYANSHYILDQMVEHKMLSQDLADTVKEVHPHFIPVRYRKGNISSSIEGMSQFVLESFNAMAKNDFGLELKSTLHSEIGKRKIYRRGCIPNSV